MVSNDRDQECFVVFIYSKGRNINDRQEGGVTFILTGIFFGHSWIFFPRDGWAGFLFSFFIICLLYTSDAADE